MERLTSDFDAGKPWDLIEKQKPYSKVYRKLQKYETAEEEGRLVVLLYKIGMTLFLPRHGEIFPFRVVGTRIYTNRTEIDLIYCGNNKCYEFLSTHPTVQYIEREYFHTREEAEKALEMIANEGKN